MKTLIPASIHERETTAGFFDTWHPKFYVLSVSRNSLSKSKIVKLYDKKPWPDVLTLSTTFYDVSVSWNLFSKAEMRRFGASGTKGFILTTFWITLCALWSHKMRRNFHGSRVQKSKRADWQCYELSRSRSIRPTGIRFTKGLVIYGPYNIMSFNLTAFNLSFNLTANPMVLHARKYPRQFNSYIFEPFTFFNFLYQFSL